MTIKQGAILLIAGICIAAVTGYVISNAVNSFQYHYEPEGTQQPSSQDPAAQAAPEHRQTIQNYTGTLSSGTSLFHNGEALAELIFQDGRTFTATEQLAAQANMTIGKTYQISFNESAPEIALEIQEAQP